MGIHGTLAGLVLGVADEMDTIITIIVAILLHKWAEAMSVGIGITKSNINLWMTIVLITIFSLATPIGIGIGFIFSDGNDYVRAFFNAVSAGTFLYISAVEVFSEEFAGKNQKYVKFLFVVLGVALMLFAWFTETWYDAY